MNNSENKQKNQVEEDKKDENNFLTSIWNFICNWWIPIVILYPCYCLSLFIYKSHLFLSKWANFLWIPYIIPITMIIVIIYLAYFVWKLLSSRK